MEQGDKPPAPGGDLPRKTPARKFDFSSSAFAGNPIAEAVAAAINRALQAIPQSQPRPQPQPQPRPTARYMNPESIMIRRPSFLEGLRTLTMKKCCNCRHSQCLKSHCECFASGGYCDGCNCTNCFNNVENEAARRDAVDAARELNPDAFKPKIDNINQGNSANRK